MKFRDLILAVALVACCAVGVGNLIQPERVAHAQSSNPNDILLGAFSASLTNQATGTICTATTYGDSRYTLPAVSPPGYTAASARFQIHYIHLYAGAATIVEVYEHPTTGSNILICTVGVNATSPYDVREGQGQFLGLNGYQTKVGSSILVGNYGGSTATVTADCVGIID